MEVRGAQVSIRDMTKDYGTTPVLKSVNLDVGAGEFLTLLGPSGCGKSTLLRIIAGLESPTRGSIAIAGQSVDGLRPKDRGLSMVFQNYALYPHLSAFDNIAMPLVMRQQTFAQRFPLLGRLLPGAGERRRRIADKVAAVARLLEIEPLLGRRPGQLSGGQRQRVALGRAIASEPSVFLMDEPLSNLDARLRIQMRNELAELHRKLGISFIYVTHDQVEAMSMSQRVAVMMDGALIQVGTPHQVYADPVDLRVARFIGTYPINAFTASVDRAGFPILSGQRVPVSLPGHAGEAVTVAVRPEDLVLEWGSWPVSSGDMCLEARLIRIEDHGADVLAHFALQDSGLPHVVVRASAMDRARLSSCTDGQCRILVPTEGVHVFDALGERIAAGDRVGVSIAFTRSRA
jgi:multiple sugar transport system ATP-binding protein